MSVRLVVACALYIQYAERVFLHFKMPSVVGSIGILIFVKLCFLM